MSRPTRESAAGRAYLDLQNQARRQNRGTQELLTMYIVERWLSRMSRSPYAEDFILKGGMLLASFGTRRPTVDADALARKMASDEETVARRVAEIAAIEDSDDGVEFLPDTVTTAVIGDDALYSGVRVTMTARLATAQVKLRLDINFGDPVTPAPQTVELPSLRLLTSSTRCSTGSTPKPSGAPANGTGTRHPPHHPCRQKPLQVGQVCDGFCRTWSQPNLVTRNPPAVPPCGQARMTARAMAATAVFTPFGRPFARIAPASRWSASSVGLSGEGAR